MTASCTLSDGVCKSTRTFCDSLKPCLKGYKLVSCICDFTYNGLFEELSEWDVTFAEQDILSEPFEFFCLDKDLDLAANNKVRRIDFDRAIRRGHN